MTGSPNTFLFTTTWASGNSLCLRDSKQGHYNLHNLRGSILILRMLLQINQKPIQTPASILGTVPLRLLLKLKLFLHFVAPCLECSKMTTDPKIARGRFIHKLNQSYFVLAEWIASMHLVLRNLARLGMLCLSSSPVWSYEKVGSNMAIKKASQVHHLSSPLRVISLANCHYSTLCLCFGGFKLIGAV